MSQQIKALENELGFSLLERHNRKFVLTPAGEHFYKKSLVLLADYEQLCRESAQNCPGRESGAENRLFAQLHQPEFRQALEEFSAQYPGDSRPAFVWQP